MENNTVIMTNDAPDPVGAYPHARRAGHLLFLSGIGPRVAGTNVIPGNVYNEKGELIEYDIAAQCHSVFKNVKAVLEASGSRWENLIDVTVFLINMKRDFPIFNDLYAQYFRQVQACRTTVEIRAFPTPIAIELKCIAIID